MIQISNKPEAIPATHVNLVAYQAFCNNFPSSHVHQFNLLQRSIRKMFRNLKFATPGLCLLWDWASLQWTELTAVIQSFVDASSPIGEAHSSPSTSFRTISGHEDSKRLPTAISLGFRGQYLRPSSAVQSSLKQFVPQMSFTSVGCVSESGSKDQVIPRILFIKCAGCRCVVPPYRLQMLRGQPVSCKSTRFSLQNSDPAHLTCREREFQDGRAIHP